jgi:hypothetical protein
MDRQGWLLISFPGHAKTKIELMGNLPGTVVELQILRVAKPFPLVERKCVDPIRVATNVELKGRHD